MKCSLRFGKEHFDKWVPKERDYVVLKSDHPKIVYKIIKVFSDGDIALVKGDKPYYSIDEVSPATYSEIKKYVEENPEKRSDLDLEPVPIAPKAIPNEGKIAGTIEQIEEVMAILRGSGRDFGSRIHASMNYEGIEWNKYSLYLVQKINNSQKPLIQLTDFIASIPAGSVKEAPKKVCNFDSNTIKFPKDFKIFKRFLIDRGGNRLYLEFTRLLKYNNLESVPLANIIYSGITWDKSIAFVEWSLIDRDWELFWRNYQRVEKEKSEKSENVNFDGLTLSTDLPGFAPPIDLDYQIPPIDFSGSMVVHTEIGKTFHIDIETAGLERGGKIEVLNTRVGFAEHLHNIKYKLIKK